MTLLGIRLMLCRHQRQALTFMLRREQGWALEGPHADIWRVDGLYTSDTTYAGPCLHVMLLLTIL